MASIPGLMRAIEDQARTRSLIRKVMSESGLICQPLSSYNFWRQLEKVAYLDENSLTHTKIIKPSFR